MSVDAALARAWMRAAAAAVTAEAEQLTRLDAAIGDGDHGVNMSRGFTAVLAVLDDAGPVAEVFVRSGSTLISKVGGASGPLYGSALRAIGKALPAEPKVEPAAFAAALAAGLAAVRKLGGAAPGDKTMVDAYAPALEAFERAVAGGSDLAAATGSAAQAAEAGAARTAEWQARKGRASYLGERSIGHPDPGATSTALIFRALAGVAAR